MDQDERIAFGQDLVASGWIKEMRRQLGVTPNVVAGWLGSTSHQVTRWEQGGQKWVQIRTAVRFADLCDAHRAANEWLQGEKMTWNQIEPLAMGAYRLGISQPTLRSRLTAADAEPIDLGSILGEWIEKVLVDACRR
jgi:hypothetical protein